MSEQETAPLYDIGAYVAIQTDEGPASRDTHGAIVAREWSARTGEHVYTIEIPRLYDGERPEYLNVREYEICGIV